MNESTKIKFPEWVNEAIRSGEEIKPSLLERLPLVDQAMELAKLMQQTNTTQEIGSVLSCAGECFKQFSTPIYIVKN